MDLGIDFVDCNKDSFELIKSLGEGMFSHVSLMRHIDSSKEVAVKMFKNVNEETQKEIMMDIDIGKTIFSKFKIEYYGHIQNEFSVWVFMEPMDMCLSEFYKKLKKKSPNYKIGHQIVAYLIYCSVCGLEDLHAKEIMHRDVKPTNMLIDKAGRFKLCDFGLSGKLKDSLVKSCVGTQAYLSPERIDPSTNQKKYNIKADVWSLGVSIMEVVNFNHPFSHAQTLLHQLTAVVMDPPPQLLYMSYYLEHNPEIIDFFNFTLRKNPDVRPSYVQLKNMELLSQFHDTVVFDAAKYDLSELVQFILT